MIRGPGHLGYRGPTGGIPRDSGAESVGYIGIRLEGLSGILGLNLSGIWEMGGGGGEEVDVT